MYLNESMGRGEALKSMLSTERPRMFLSIFSALLCTVVEIVPWVSLYLGANALYAGEPIYQYLLAMTFAWYLDICCTCLQCGRRT
ncbi:hypothetical protein [Vibrio sonorensis]|uniref:hypothetical protein n=1 Tax=Vibrio sonorensis TaxID=1004316 RepID=UPI00316AC91D